MQENELFLAEEWAKGHVRSIGRSPLERTYALTYLREAVDGCSTVLDVGCCGANLFDLLCSHNLRLGYCGVDFSPASLSQAQLRHPGAWLIQANGAELPFREDVFDLSYQRDVIIHQPDPLGMLGEMYRVGKKVLFNARVSPRIRAPLKLRDPENHVLYTILPDYALFAAIADLAPPPAVVRFKFVEVIGTNPQRFQWNGHPHYCDVLGDGAQYHVHCLVTKGAAGCKTRIVDETSNWRAHPFGLPWGYNLLRYGLQRGLRRAAFRILGPASFHKLRSLVKRAR